MGKQSLTELARDLRPLLMPGMSMTIEADAVSVLAGSGLSGGGVLTEDRTLAIDLAANLTWTGNHAFQGGLTTRHVLPEAADAYDLGSASALWRRIYASEFDTYLLKANAISVVGGRILVAKATGTLPNGAAAAATQVNFGAAMTANDFVLLRTLGQVEYMQVGSLVSGTSYNVTRNLDGSGANDWPAGAVWVNLGYNGSGRVELDAETTPRVSIKRQGTTYNALLGEPVRIGDLNGWDTVGTERYGIGLGDFSAGNYLRYEAGSGFVIAAGADAVKIDGGGIRVYSLDAVPGSNRMYGLVDPAGTVRGYLAGRGASGADTFLISLKGRLSGGPSPIDLGGIDISLSGLTGTPATAITLSGNSITLDTDTSVTGSIKASVATAVRAYHDTTQSIGNNAWTALNLNQARFDDRPSGLSAQHDAVTNNTRLTCRVAGTYLIGGCAALAANSTGDRGIAIVLNGTTEICMNMTPALVSSFAHVLSTSCIYKLAVGDYVELKVYQNSGGSLNSVNNGNRNPEFWMSRMV